MAVVELRGPETAEFLARHVRLRGGRALEPGRVRRAELLDASGEPVDDVLLTIQAGPPDWDVHLHLHGNPVLVSACLALGRACGLAAEEAGPSPWPTVDALEAEGIQLLPQFATRRGAEWLLRNVVELRSRLRGLAARLADTTDPAEVARAAEQVARLAELPDVAAWFTRPVRIALLGPPNAGKSTLANALADRTVSLVSAQPGTTRDWIEIPGELEGYPVIWIDTAGVQSTADAVEAAAIDRTRAVHAASDLSLVVLDAARPDDPAQREFLASHADWVVAAVLLNKCDYAEPERLRAALPEAWRPGLPISARERGGLDRLAEAALAALGRNGGPLLGCPYTLRQRSVLQGLAGENDHKSMAGMILEVIGGKS